VGAGGNRDVVVRGPLIVSAVRAIKAVTETAKLLETFFAAAERPVL
jgi:hypothetical protein